MKKMPRRSKLGGFNYVTATLLILALAAAFFAYNLAPIYWAESEWKHTIKDQIINASENDDLTIRNTLQDKAEELGIPLVSGDGLSVSRFQKTLTIKYSYERETMIPGMDVISFENEYREEIKPVLKLFNDK